MDITSEGLVVGIFALAIGLAFTFMGLKLFLILLPIWGFFAGFVLGAQVTTEIFGDAFLATTFSWVVGFLVGLLFAVLSYLYYYVAVAILGGVLGYQLTLGVLTWIGFSGDGLIAIVLALIVGAIFAVGFIVLAMPVVLAIVATAILGAATTILGIVVALGIIPVAALQTAGIIGAHWGDDLNWLWIVAGIVLAFVGGWYQARATADMAARIQMDSYRNPGLGGGPTATAGA
jgi:hypothetical protein